MQKDNIKLSHAQINKLFISKNQPLTICLLADNIELPRNIGSLFRVADAFGVEKIYLNNPSDLISDKATDLKIRKAARSTHKKIDFSHTESAIKLIGQLKQSGYSIISLEITTTSQDIRQFSKSAGDKICLVIGSEKNGISQPLLNASEQTLHIAMYGKNSSMNVVTATRAIALK